MDVYMKKDLVGIRFGKLIVTGDSGKRKGEAPILQKA